MTLKSNKSIEQQPDMVKGLNKQLKTYEKKNIKGQRRSSHLQPGSSAPLASRNQLGSELITNTLDETNISRITSSIQKDGGELDETNMQDIATLKKEL